MNATDNSDENRTQIPVLHGVADLIRLEIRYGDGSRRELSRTEANLLSYLAAHSGRTVTRDELLASVWHFKNPERVTTRTVDMHVAKLRQKLLDNADNPNCIFTVPYEGYMLIEAPAAQAEAA
jgi:DNA-binding response OmpR family regulator